MAGLMKIKDKRFDSWANTLTGIGTTRDKQVYGSFYADGSLDDETLDALYHEDDVARTICEAMPEYALRKGFNIILNANEDDKDPKLVRDLKKTQADINNAADALDIVGKVEDCVIWANAYGGSVIMPGYGDGIEGDGLKEPLDENRIEEITHFTVFDRRYVLPFKWYGNPAHPKFGMPETYLITPFIISADTDFSDMSNRAGIYEVHETRLIIFEGARTSLERRSRNNGWPDSVLTRVYKVLKSYGMSWDVLPYLLTDASQAVFKMRGYIDALAADSQDTVALRMQLMDMSRSVTRALVLDAEDEDFRRESFRFDGMREIFEIIERRLCLAADTPSTLLFGRSPAGENATGEADFQNFDSKVESYQRKRMLKPITRMVELICLSKKGPTGGKVPENMDVKFPELRSLTPMQEVEIRNKQAQTDGIYVDKGVLEPEEVALSRWSPDGYSIETSINTDSRIAPQTPEEYEEKHQMPDMTKGGPDGSDNDTVAAEGQSGINTEE